MLSHFSCHALLQGIFLTQGLNPSLLHLLRWQTGSLPLAPPGLSRIYLYVYLGLCNINLKEDRHGVRMLNDNNFLKRYRRIDLCVSVLLSHVRLFATPWTVAHQAPLSMEFSSKEYWSELPFPSPGDVPNPGIESGSPKLQADSLSSEPPGQPIS